MMPVLAIAAIVLVVAPPLALRASGWDRTGRLAYWGAWLTTVAAACATLMVLGSWLSLASMRPDELASDVVVVLAVGTPLLVLPLAAAAGTVAVRVVALARAAESAPPPDRLPGPTAAPTI